MNTLSVRIAESPQKAPNYRGGDYEGAELREAVIVLNGTVSGNSTVDLVFDIKDATGKVTAVAVALTTGAIIKMLAQAIEGAEQRK